MSKKKQIGIHEASESLCESLSQFRWVTGVGKSDDVIFLYVTSNNHKELKTLKEWKGFPVSIKVTGKVKPASVGCL